MSPLAHGAAPAWATAWGEDRHGVFAAFTVAGVTQRLRWVPPGQFVMGSPEVEVGRWDDEGPQHEVVLTQGYWLGETPVTQALWAVVMGSNPSRFESADRPVEMVSWDDCEAFVEELNARVVGLDVRLPTEAEWERACRGGTQTATWVGDLKLEDPGQVRSATLDAIAWYGGNSGGTTHPVGEKAANPFGLLDMLGNVQEWCADCYGAYNANSTIDPMNPTQSPYRVLRGGSWSGDARSVRAASRESYISGNRFDFIGFRLASSPSALRQVEPGEAPRGGPRGGVAARRSGAEGSGRRE
ncbi:MAG: formylglycine-generating enzyme family protein [Polyangiales bacterium]